MRLLRTPAPRVKVVLGLGNPGLEYARTRHNVGWWVLDRFAFDQGFGPFRRKRRAWEASGETAGWRVRLLKPRTYVNRSGLALTTLWKIRGFEFERDLLVVADDINLAVGRVRFRPGGGSGGHRGLASVNEALGSQGYPRLRIGVGAPPPGTDRADWVLGVMPGEDEGRMEALLSELSEAVGVWVGEGVAAVMNRFNQ